VDHAGKATFGMAFRALREWISDSGHESSGDGKGTNYNIAKVKTGNRINSSEGDEILRLAVHAGPVVDRPFL
jgi:hypothetical protein